MLPAFRKQLHGYASMSLDRKKVYIRHVKIYYQMIEDVFRHSEEIFMQ